MRTLIGIYIYIVIINKKMKVLIKRKNKKMKVNEKKHVGRKGRRKGRRKGKQSPLSTDSADTRSRSQRKRQLKSLVASLPPLTFIVVSSILLFSLLRTTHTFKNLNISVPYSHEPIKFNSNLKQP